MPKRKPKPKTGAELIRERSQPGWVGPRGPEVGLVGEQGPEYIIPLRMLFRPSADEAQLLIDVIDRNLGIK